MIEETIQLNASKRQVVGKQVKQLRRQGLVPAVLYGPSLEPLNLQMPEHELAVILARAGGSHIIQLNVEGDTYPVLVREVQRDNLRDDLIHVDLYAVSMDRAIRAEIPLDFVNEAPLVTARQAMLIAALNSVEVECLPTDLPAAIQVDTSVLVDMDTAITVADLQIPSGVEVLAEPSELVAILSYIETPEEEEEEEEEILVDAEDVEVIARGKAEEESEGE